MEKSGHLVNALTPEEGAGTHTAPNEVEEEHVRWFKWLEEVPPNRPEMDEYQAEQEYPQAHGWINIFQLTELDLCDASNEEANHVWIEKVGIGDEDFQKVVKLRMERQNEIILRYVHEIRIPTGWHACVEHERT